MKTFTWDDVLKVKPIILKKIKDIAPISSFFLYPGGDATVIFEKDCVKVATINKIISLFKGDELSAEIIMLPRLAIDIKNIDLGALDVS